MKLFTPWTETFRIVPVILVAVLILSAFTVYPAFTQVPSAAGTQPGTKAPAGKRSTPIVAVHGVSWETHMGSGTSSNYGSMPVDSIDFSVMTHYLHNSVRFTSDATDIAWGNMLIDRRKPLNDRAHAAGTPVLLVFGGSGSDADFTLALSPAYRQTAINTILRTIRTYEFDGIDWDWEPFRSGDTVNLFPTIRALYDSFQTMNAYYDPSRRPIITADLNSCCGNPDYWVKVQDYLEFYNIMSYDKMGDWTHKTLWDCSIYSRDENGNIFERIGGSTQQEMPSAQKQAFDLLAGGVEPGKVVFGIDYMASSASGGTGMSAGGATRPRELWSSAPAFNRDYKFDIFYRDYLDTASAAIKKWDDAAKVYYLSIDKPGSADDKFMPYLGGPGQDSSLYYALRLVEEMGVGGVMIWDLGETYLGTDRFPASSYPDLERNWLINQLRKYVGKIEPPPPPDVPKIRGDVFFDQNQNHAREPGEPLIAGWNISLSGPETMSAVSDSSGSFSFNALDLGGYTVALGQKAGWTQTYPLSQQPHAESIDTARQTVVLDFGVYSGQAFSFDAGRNWNIVSLPVTVSDRGVPSVFPLSMTPAYAFHGGYEATEELEYGEGYWIKVSTGHTVWLSGTPRTRDTTDVVKGWNFIGSVSAPVPVSRLSSIPPGIYSYYIYGYDGGSFLADTILPGKGYWVSVNQAGKIVISASTEMSPGQAFTAPVPRFSTLTFTSATGESQVLYYGENPSGTTGFSTAPAPPGPPEKVFSAGFRNGGDAGSGSIVALIPAQPLRKENLRIDVTDVAYPLTVSWENGQGDREVVLTGGEGIRQTLAGKGSFVVAGGTTGGPDTGGDEIFYLSVSPEMAGAVPTDYSLDQNYPNPFNSSTIIRFSLPEESRVTLELFNTLGELVSTVLDADLPGGYHSAPVDASALASGVYFYKLTALRPNSLTYSSTKKFLLVR